MLLHHHRGPPRHHLAHALWHWVFETDALWFLLLAVLVALLVAVL